MQRATAILLRLILLLAAALGSAAPLRVATMNARNYNGGDRHVDGTWRPGYPKPEEEKEALRMVIHSVHPDVLVLQEIGGPEYLEELQRDLRQEGRDYPHSAHLLAHDTDRCLAVISTVPIAESTGHKDVPYQLNGGRQTVRRGLLEVSFTIDSQTLKVFAIHLKSRLTDDPSDPDAAKQRAGEAGAVRRAIENRVPPGVHFLIAGDLNDVPGSPAYKRLTERSNMPFAVDIRPLDTRGEAWTYRHLPSDSHERVDFLLLSPALARMQGDPACGLYDGPAALGGSDHRMLWVDLNFSDNLPKN